MYKGFNTCARLRLSGLSGCVRLFLTGTGQKKRRTFNVLSQLVRLVRLFFNSLMYTCAPAIEMQTFNYGLGSLFLTGQAGQMGKDSGFAGLFVSGCGVFRPDTTGQAGQVTK